MNLPIAKTQISKPNFYDSQICKTQLSCSLCRSLDDKGTRFRQTVRDNYQEMVFDFPCPYSKEWNVRHSAPSRVIIEAIESKQVAQAIIIKPAFRIGDYVHYWIAKWGFTKKQGCNCQKRQDWLNEHSQQIITALAAVVAVSLFLVWL